MYKFKLDTANKNFPLPQKCCSTPNHFMISQCGTDKTITMTRRRVRVNTFALGIDDADNSCTPMFGHVFNIEPISGHIGRRS